MEAQNGTFFDGNYNTQDYHNYHNCHNCHSADRVASYDNHKRQREMLWLMKSLAVDCLHLHRGYSLDKITKLFTITILRITLGNERKIISMESQEYCN